MTINYSLSIKVAGHIKGPAYTFDGIFAYSYQVCYHLFSGKPSKDEVDAKPSPKDETDAGGWR